MYKNPYIKIKPHSDKPYTEIYLIRHCHPDYDLEKKVGERNMPLSAFGRRQRTYLNKRLNSLKIDQIYTSSLVRAKQTAELYAKKNGQEIIVDARLDEINWKSWYNLKYFNMSEERRRTRFKNHVKLNHDLDKIQAVARRALADIYHHNVGKSLAIFSHGNFIRAILTGILDSDILGFLSLEIFQASLSKLVLDNKGYIKISYINDISHLPLVRDHDLFIAGDD